MARHPLDPISLIFGIVFVIAGIICLTGGEVIDQGRFLLPLGLIGLGTAVMIQAGKRSQAETGSAGQDGAGDEVGAEGSEYRQVQESGGRHDS